MALPSVIPIAPSAGEKLGESLGAGLTSGIQALANMKLQQMQQRQQQARTAQGLQALFPDMPQQQLSALAQLDPQSLGIYLKEKIAAPRRQAYAQALAQEMGMPQQQAVGQLSSALQPMMQQEGQPMPGFQPGMQQPMQQGFQAPLELTEQQATNLANIRMKRQKEEREARQFERKFGAEQQKEIEKTYARQFPAIEKAGEAAKSRNERKATVKELATLIGSGEVITGKPRQLLSKLGWEKFFTNPSTENAQYIMQGLIGNTVRNVGVSKMTNKLATIEQGMTPDILNQPESIMTWAKNELLNIKAEEVYDNIRDELYEQFRKANQKLPENFQSLVNRKAQPAVDQIYEKEYRNYLALFKDKLPSPAQWRKDGGGEGDIVASKEMPGVQWLFKNNNWEIYLDDEED
jgi:hypothetical protein